MITKSPYGDWVGPKGRIAGTEPEYEALEYIRKPDPQPVIDRCLTCTRQNCTGNCSFHPDGTAKPDPSTAYKRKQRELRQRKEEEESRRETARAKEIARMVLDGWCESGIAQEKGMSLKEVQFLVKQARKKGFLY